MEMNLEKKTLIFVGVLVVIALISFFLVGSWASQEENFVGTCQGLDNKKTTVTELMGVTAASSTAITLIPGDTGTPIAEQLADMSGYAAPWQRAVQEHRDQALSGRHHALRHHPGERDRDREDRRQL